MPSPPLLLLLLLLAAAASRGQQALTSAADVSCTDPNANVRTYRFPGGRQSVPLDEKHPMKANL